MNISVAYKTSNLSMQGKNNNKSINAFLEPLKTNKKAVVPPKTLLRGVSVNNGNPFDTFVKIDDATRKINFVKSQESWDSCLMDEVIEFTQARQEYQETPTPQNFDHMQEEMGDIFFTAASIAKDAGIDSQEAFITTLRKNANRLNLMERMTDKDLATATDSERRGLWNSAKRMMYNAQSFLYLDSANKTSADN